MSLIEKYGLSEKEVQEIVKEWYSNGMTPDIFVNDYGIELDEYCDNITYDEIFDFHKHGYEEIISDMIWCKTIGDTKIVVVYDFYKDYIKVTSMLHEYEVELVEGVVSDLDELSVILYREELKINK